MSQTTTLAIVAVVSAIGLLGIVVTEPIFVGQHQAAAAGQGPFRGCTNQGSGTSPAYGIAFNASKTRCFHP